MIILLSSCGGKMLENILDKKSNFDLTLKSTFSNESDVFTSRSYAALLARNIIPYYHRKLADNYVIIKKIYKFQAVLSRISNVEKALLNKYNFNTLEFTTMKQMYEEIALLQKWANDDKLKNVAEQLLEIRVKELKYLDASRYASVSNEIYNGYQALEHYLQEISRFPA